MAPTEILAKQHYNLAKKLFSDSIEINLLTGKTENKERKAILKNLLNGKVDLLIELFASFKKNKL